MKPVRILLDTDLGSDCDDAGALAVLHALADAGEAEIVATVYSSEVNPYGLGCLAAINSWYGRASIPIGAAGPGELGDPRNDFLEPIARDRSRYGHTLVSRDEAPGLIAVCRRSLAESPDNSVQVVSIGHTKGLFDLLHSVPDDISSLSGTELVARKVKTWVAMGGEFPHEAKPGWNFGCNGAARYSGEMVDRWPTPIVFCGFEIGAPILTGRGLRHAPDANPVREAYRLWDQGISLEKGRPSWDQATVLFAVRGLGSHWELVRGRCTVDETGRSHWNDAAQSPHAYLRARTESATMARIIEELMLRPPAKRAP